MNDFARGVQYQGHLLEQVPTIYVCGECGGVLVVSYPNAEITRVKCSINDDHQGFERATLWAELDAAVKAAIDRGSAEEIKHLGSGTGALARTVRRLTALRLAAQRHAVYGGPDA